jgi:hypothetical protein
MSESVTPWVARVFSEGEPSIEVLLPQDPRMIQLINMTAKFVATDGESIEQVFHSSLICANAFCGSMRINAFRCAFAD